MFKKGNKLDHSDFFLKGMMTLSMVSSNEKTHKNYFLRSSNEYETIRSYPPKGGSCDLNFPKKFEWVSTGRQIVFYPLVLTEIPKVLIFLIIFEKVSFFLLLS